MDVFRRKANKQRLSSYVLNCKFHLLLATSSQADHWRTRSEIKSITVHKTIQPNIWKGKGSFGKMQKLTLVTTNMNIYQHPRHVSG